MTFNGTLISYSLNKIKVDCTATIKYWSLPHVALLFSGFIQETFEPVCAFLSNKLSNFDVMHDTPFNSKKCYITLSNWYNVY